MKHVLKLSLFILILLVSPIISASEPYTLTLNDIIYEPQKPLITKDNALYIALEDLADITFSEVTQNDKSYTFNTQNETIKIGVNQAFFNRNSKTILLKNQTFMSGDTLYVPIRLIEALDYPLEVNNHTHTISINTLEPISRNSDNPDNHTFIPATYTLNNLPKHLFTLSSPEQLESDLQAITAQKKYISFVDNTQSDAILNLARNRMRASPYNNMKVSFRVINTHTYPNVITDTVTVPLKIQTVGKTLRITLGDSLFDYSNIWATYYPKRSSTEIDLHKSFDATIMNALYEYYRNTYEFKDDIYFKPYAVITSDQTNILTRFSYSLTYDEKDLNNEIITPYEIRIHRVHPSGTMHFMIDIYKAQ